MVSILSKNKRIIPVFLLSISFLLTVFYFGSQKTPTVLTLSAAEASGGLVGYWKLDEGSGQIASDLSGYGNGLMLGGDVSTANDPQWVTGKFGNALQFDGTKWAQLPDSDNYEGGTEKTLSLWIKPNDLSKIQAIMEKYSIGETGPYVLALCSNAPASDGKVFVLARDASGVLNGFAAGTTYPLSVGQWYHIAFVINTSAPTPTDETLLYINGIKQARGGASNCAGPTNNDLGALRVNDKPLFVGVRDSAGGKSNAFNGIIDDIRIYDRALSEAEVLVLYNNAVDSLPPVGSNDQPDAALPSGTTATTISLTTNESAVCKYSATAGMGYASMPNTFLTTGATSHSATVSGLVDGNFYKYYVKCRDVSGNANTEDFLIRFSVALPGDSNPPVRSNGQPDGALPSGTVSVTLSLTTDEIAVCKYGTTAGIDYVSMPSTFSTTEGTSHSTKITGLSDGNSYNYYVRCRDVSGNVNTDDLAVSFSVTKGIWGPINTIYYNPGEDDPSNNFLQQAATELKTHLESIPAFSGKTFSINTAAPPAIGILIRVEPSNPDLLSRNKEAFKLYSDGKSIYVIGKTPIAARHGAYALLEKLGVRWFFKSPAWTVIPDSPNDLTGLNEVQEPAIIYRFIWHPPSVDESRYDEWYRRNRLGGAEAYEVGHNYGSVIPRSEFATNPELFCPQRPDDLARGTIAYPWQLRPDNPVVFQRSLENVRTQLGTPGHAILSPNDGKGWCADFASDKQLVTDKVFNLTNEVAKVVKTEFPGKYVGIYSYSDYSCVPSIALSPNLLVEIATDFNNCGQSIKTRVDGFASKGVLVGIRDYYDVFSRSQPMQENFWNLLRLIPPYASHGVKVINAESSDSWGSHGLFYYIASKLYWQPKASIDALLDDFYTKAFGPAKEPMKKYYEKWNNEVAVSNSTLAVSFRNLAEAQTLAAGDEKILERLRHTQYYMRFLWKWQKKDTMTAAELKDYYSFMCKTVPLYITMWRYTGQDLRNLMAGKGVPQAEWDAVCNTTPPTPAEAQAWLDEALTYFKDVVAVDAPVISPYRLSLAPLGDTATPELPPFTFSAYSILVPSNGNETVILLLKGTVGPYDAIWYGPDNFEVARIPANTGFADFTPITLPASEAGLYRLQINPPTRAIFKADRPVSVDATSFWMYGSGQIYFYVPKGTPGLVVGVKLKGTLPDPGGHGVVKLIDPDRLVALEMPFGVETYTDKGLYSPKPGLWKLDTTHFGKTGNPFDYRLYGIPPFVWHDPKYLLVPASAAAPPPFSISNLNRLYLFQEKSNLFQVSGSFNLSDSFSLKFNQDTSTLASFTFQPKDTSIIETNLTTNQLTPLPLGFYDLALERISDSYKLTYAKKLLITKLGDLWSQTATETSEQRRDGKVDIYDASRILSKWGSTAAADLAEADINPGPGGISAGKIDLYDANLMMRNWGP